MSTSLTIVRLALALAMAIIVGAASAADGSDPTGGQLAGQITIPEPEYTLIRAIGFIDGPPLIAKTCGRVNRVSERLWDKEVDSFEQRRAREAAQARRIFAETYGQAISQEQLHEVLQEKADQRLIEEAAVNHVDRSTLCLIVSLVAGKKAFESPGFEETMQLLDQYDKAGDYRRLKAKIARETPSERAIYLERLRAYQMKPAKPARRD